MRETPKALLKVKGSCSFLVVLVGNSLKRQQRILYLALILIFSVTGCDQATMQKTLSDLTSDATGSLGDPFEKGTLQNPNWKWQNEPPQWNIGETRDNHLFIETERNRNLWASDATHLLYQEIETDVFDVETRFTVRWNTDSGVTGLIVKSPTDDDWVTLKFWARDASARGFIQFDRKLNQWNKDGLTGNAWQSTVYGELDLFFRLAKDGDTYTSWYKTAEADTWIHVGTTDFKLTPPLWVGIYAGNAASLLKYRMQVEFEYFRDNLTPFLNTD